MPKTKKQVTMQGWQLVMWEAIMLSTGKAVDQNQLIDMLGVSRQAYWYMRKNGADLRTDLACRALAYGLKPWSAPEETT